MDLDFLPINLQNATSNCNLDNLYELRLRVGFYVKALTKEGFCYLTENGISLFKEKAMKCEQKDIDNIIRNVTEFSVYAHNDKLKNGYLSTKNGVRIGVAGECVYSDSKIVTIKNITSLNIRIPHNIDGCADKLMHVIYDKVRIYNSLIVSPPIQGKTTILKDIAKQLNEFSIGSILIIDERGEFVDVKGENIDTIAYSSKDFAFEFGVRALSPKIIITDELLGEADWNCVYNAKRSGVSVIASCHGYSLDDVTTKDFYRNNVFERIILLDGKSIGKIKEVIYI